MAIDISNKPSLVYAIKNKLTSLYARCNRIVTVNEQ